MEVRLLGPLELADGGRSIAYGGARQRAVLALLVLHADQVMPSERVLLELWGEDTRRARPTRSRRPCRGCAGRCPKRLVTRPPGYLFRAFADEIDLARFERLLARARQALADGAAAEASETLGLALALWRGPALADLAYEPFAQAEIARLDELRLVCLEERIEADLALGAARRAGRRAPGPGRRASAARAAARPAHARPVPQRPPGRGPRRLPRGAGAAARRAGP